MVTLTELHYMRYLRFFGFYKESYKIIVGWWKIFSQITLTLIFPLSFIFLIHIQLSNILFKETLTLFEQVTFCIFKVIYFTFLLSLSLLPTSAVVYAVASIYTAKDVTFNRVISAVLKVWKKLMVTFLFAMVKFSLYIVIALPVFIIWKLTTGRLGNFGATVFAQLLVSYLFWLVHLVVIWQIAFVVTVLDLELGDLYKSGDAIRKSDSLMTDRVAEFIVFKLNVPLFAIPYLFTELVVVQGWRMGSVSGNRAIAYGILCFLLVSLFFLFGIVMQTVIYFVFKQHHGQMIDKAALSDHLEMYQGEYAPLKA